MGMSGRRLSTYLRARALLVQIVAVALIGVSAFSPVKSQPSDFVEIAKPNIVFILTDDQTFESLAKMPYTNGRSDWIRFGAAFHNNPLCCPSRATLLTGQYSHRNGVENNTQAAQFDESSTLPTWLKDAGYENALVGKYFNDYPFGRPYYIPPGWDTWAAQLHGRYYDYTIYDDRAGIEKYGSEPHHYSTDVLANKAIDFIGRARGPFFLQFAPFAPHSPRIPAPRHANTFVGTPIYHSPNFNEQNVDDKPLYMRRTPKVKPKLVDEDRRKAYRALLAVDEAVRDIFVALEARNMLDNTVVVFTSDNGYMFGEHRLGRKRCGYEECLKAPLLIRYPGLSGRTVSNLVSNVDIAPTIGAFAGAAVPPDRDGFNVMPLVRGTPESWRAAVLLRNSGAPTSLVGGAEVDEESTVPSYWGIRTDRYKYLELETGERELYDLHEDPFELRNRANQPTHLEIQASLAAQLQELKG